MEDFEAVNTVLCFGAYCLDRDGQRFGSVLDLGANIGIATRHFLKLLPGVPILAIEPCPKNCELLRHNIFMAPGNDRVLVWQCAVGPVDGVGHFRDAPHGNTRFDSHRIAYGEADHGAPEIPICSMARAVAGLTPPILVKMDVEGTEQTLLSCRTEWTGGVGRMMIEFHDSARERYWITTLESENWRSKKRFDTWHFWRAAA
jgi:FkbM family methyltransferase